MRSHPLSLGDDGDMVEPDVAFEETCASVSLKKDAETLKKWLNMEQEKDGGVKMLAERWALDPQELNELVARLG
ncbi:hypothetical protein C0992_005799 [Termitomyces sp. T32_za158]|nr:hypothetical protein C0992_005799 [Termitomyces sp. T32_za158]